VKENFKGLSLMEARVEAIELESSRFLGKTEELFRDLQRSWETLKSRECKINEVPCSLKQLIDGEKNEGWLKSYISGQKYIENCEWFNQARLADLFRIFKIEESRVLGKLEQLEMVLQGLPAFLLQASGDLGEISQRVSFIINQSQIDGFFPLRNLQMRLIPSIEALLDVSAKVGATDPVSAFENSVKLAARQIQDASLISRKVLELRKGLIPSVRRAVKKLGENGISTIWIDEAYLVYSKELETISNFALLWPISTKLHKVTEQLDLTHLQIIRAQKISRHLEVFPKINQLEAKINTVRGAAASRIEVDPGLILREENFDPSNRLIQAKRVTKIIKEHCSRGQIGEAEADSHLLDTMLKEVEWLLQVSEFILEKGDAFAIEITTRLDLIAKKAPQILSKLDTITRKHSREALDLNHRFDVQWFAKDSIADCLAGLMPKMREAALFLRQSRKHFRFGNLFKTSWVLQKASANIDLMETWMVRFEEQVDALEQVEISNPIRHADLRWRYRGLSSKANDPRCRQRTLGELSQVGKNLELIHNSFSLPSQNPFSISHQLEWCRRKIGEIEGMIIIDQKWHEMATETIKHAARTLRVHASLLREIEGRGISRKLAGWQQKYHGLRQKLEGLQASMEEKHHDWDEAFISGTGILTESAKQMRLIKDEDRLSALEASVAIEEAAQRIKNLLNWQNGFSVAIDREVGLAWFGEATVALVSGDFEAAKSRASLSKQRAGSELIQAMALAKRALLKIESQKRRQCDESVNLFTTNSLPEDFQVLSLQDYLARCAVFEFGFSQQESIKPKVLANDAEIIQADTLDVSANAEIGLANNKSAA
jgi:hypothetical protein